MSIFSYDRPSLKTVMKVIVIVLVLASIVLGGGWFFFGYMMDVVHVMWAWFLNSVWRASLFPNGWNIIFATPLFWLVALASFFALLSLKESFRRRLKVPLIVSGVLWVVFAMVSTFMWSDWNARHYNEASSYVVSSVEDLPDSLERISDSTRAQVGIIEGQMPSNWEPRVASATGAAYVMEKTGDSNANTVLMSETVSYIYSDAGNGSWTGIRNGKNRQPIFGVVSWSGAGETVKNCEFKGDHELRRAFGGKWGINLNDDIAEFDPNFVYDDSDVYGYCDGDKPVIVIPGARVKGINFQTALESYGVMIITGSTSGEPQIEFRDTIEQGELPGPVYPVKLVEKQRDALTWSAGRIWFWQPPVGFDATDSTSQDGNSTDFLLKSSDEDGRLYWVTPLKPRSTDSQTIVAYAMVAADEISQGEMNEQLVYVLNDEDPNIVNFNDLENAVTQAVGKKDPGFFTGAEENVGRIVEFIPTGTGTWSVFAERGGRAVYQINVSGGARLNTTVISLDDGGEELSEPEPTEAQSLECDEPSQLSDVEIAQCISSLSEELVSRNSDDVSDN